MEREIGGLQRFPMFRQGSIVQVTHPAIGLRVIGKVEMASVKHKSLFIALADGTRLAVVGVPRPRDERKAKR